LLRTLPRLLRVRTGTSAAWVEANLRYPLEEVRAGRPGSSSLLARSAELLFLDVLRRHIAEREPEELGWLGALRDPPVAKALELLHAEPAAAWTVPLLARRVGVSRSVLAERFRLHLGQPPMQYLTRWRLQLGARLLREAGDSIAAIAERVGYESERAFHRAFKRHAGVTPAVWRDAGRRRSAVM
jgi:transcriptional regulator GlxA family with amidase domain